MNDICFSGGADGADVAFGSYAQAAGHRVVHWSFTGHSHKSQAPVSTIQVLSKDDLRLADPLLVRANETLRRAWPVKSTFVANLLRRNWFQVADSEHCYAVATITKGMVDGGTAWAVQMFIDRHAGAPCSCYVFCQQTSRWFHWQGHWNAIDAPPRPSGHYAGIGSRSLLPHGREAIAALYGATGAGITATR